MTVLTSSFEIPTMALFNVIGEKNSVEAGHHIIGGECRFLSFLTVNVVFQI